MASRRRIPGHGPRFKYGAKFKLGEPASWWAPDEELVVDDAKRGHLRLRLWRRLHFEHASEWQHGLAVIRVECMDRPKTKPMCLGYLGQEQPSLELLWRL